MARLRRVARYAGSGWLVPIVLLLALALVEVVQFLIIACTVDRAPRILLCLFTI